MTLPKQEPRPERNTWFELVRTDAGWHVRLVAANGETVMSSEVHPDRRDAEHVYGLCRGALPRNGFVDERAWPEGSDEPVPFELTDKGKSALEEPK